MDKVKGTSFKYILGMYGVDDQNRVQNRVQEIIFALFAALEGADFVNFVKFAPSEKPPN